MQGENRAGKGRNALGEKEGSESRLVLVLFRVPLPRHRFSREGGEQERGQHRVKEGFQVPMAKQTKPKNKKGRDPANLQFAVPLGICFSSRNAVISRGFLRFGRTFMDLVNEVSCKP